MAKSRKRTEKQLLTSKSRGRMMSFMTNAQLLAQIKSATDKSPKAVAARKELARRRQVELEKTLGPASGWTSMRTGNGKMWS